MIQQSVHSSSFEFMWGQYNMWTVISQKNRRQVKIQIALVLFFGVLACLAATVCLYVDAQASVHAVWLSGFAVAVSGYLGGRLLTNKKIKIWFQSQAAAEVCKSHAFLYLLKVSPYNGYNDDSLLFQKGQQLSKSLCHIAPVTLSRKDALKGIPDFTYSFGDYMHERVLKHARGYYLLKAASYRRLLKRVGKVITLVGFTGFVVAAFGILTARLQVAAWIALGSTIIVSLVSFMIANRYQYLALSYQATGTQLKRLWFKSSLLDSTATDALKGIVHDCEIILAIENKAWMIEAIKEPGITSAPQENVRYAVGASLN